MRLLRFLSAHKMLNREYGRLGLRYLRRRFLTHAGRRWQTDGLVFFGRELELEVGRTGELRLGRFVWLGDRTKIRCHEGVVEIGDKTVFGQECTISAYQLVKIGRECVIADRAMFIDFDHGVVEVERPIRRQGIYKRDVEVGSNVWVGYGAAFLRACDAIGYPIEIALIQHQRDARERLFYRSGSFGLYHVGSCGRAVHLRKDSQNLSSRVAKTARGLAIEIDVSRS